MFKKSKKRKERWRNLDKFITDMMELLEGVSRLGLVLVNLHLSTEKHEIGLKFFNECKETLLKAHIGAKKFNLKLKQEKDEVEK